jgi:hypothetical protein
LKNRTSVGPCSEGERALQPSPGVYNERFLVAMDNLLVQAGMRGIRILLCFTNYWVRPPVLMHIAARLFFSTRFFSGSIQLYSARERARDPRERTI